MTIPLLKSKTRLLKNPHLYKTSRCAAVKRVSTIKAKTRTNAKPMAKLTFYSATAAQYILHKPKTSS